MLIHLSPLPLPSPTHSPPHLFRQLRYTQVALTQDTDSDSYSHRPVYPPYKRFFIEPKAAASAIKCKIAVVDSQRELCRLLVVPFSPKRGKQDSMASWGRVGGSVRKSEGEGLGDFLTMNDVKVYRRGRGSK